MDGLLDSPNPTPLPPLDLDAPLTATGKRPVGRPAVSAEQRALSDMKYAAMMTAIDALPVEATEYRFGVYPARRRVDAKAEFHPLCKILLSEWNQNNFKDMATLANYLGERFGSGRYVIEALDSFNRRLDKIAPLYVMAGDPGMIDDDLDGDERFDDEDDRRPRRRTRRLRDEDQDDPVAERANMADLLVASTRQAAGQTVQAARSQTDMMGLLLLTQSRTDETRAAEERRREESRAEERRREETRAEERRREQAEDRKREEDRAERERKEERDRDERIRQAQAEDRRREDQKRQDENLALMKAQNERTQMILTGLTSLGPVLSKLFEKRESPMEIALTRSLTEKKEADPLQMMLLKSILDRGERKDGTEMMVQQMIEFSKVSSQMTAEQMRGAMAMSNDMNREMLKRAMAMMEGTPQGQTPEGKNFLTQMMEALAGAGEFAKAIFPVQPAAIAAPPPQQAQQRRALPHQRQQVQQPQQPQPAQAAQSAGPAQALTPEQQAQLQAQADDAPKGVTGVLAALMAIHGHQYETQEQYQGLVAYCLTQMPVDLRVAIIEGQEATVFAIVQPFYEAQPELKAWISKPDVLLWIRDFVPKLSPHILQMHGSHDEQRAQLQGLLAAQAREDEEARLAAEAQGQQPAVAQPGNAVQPAPAQPGNAVQPPPAQESDLAITPDGGSAPAEPPSADQILPVNPQLMEGAAVGGAVQLDGAVARGPVAVPVAPQPAPAPSHLDPDAP
jgi:hypothetical protein